MCLRQARQTYCLFPESWNWLSGNLAGLLSCRLQTALGSPSRAVWKLWVLRFGVSQCRHILRLLLLWWWQWWLLLSGSFPSGLCLGGSFLHLFAKPPPASILNHQGLKSVYFCIRNKCPSINSVLFFGKTTLNLGHAFISSGLQTGSPQSCKGLFVLFFFSFTTAVIENTSICSPPSSSPGWWLGRATCDLPVLETCCQ